MKMESKNFLFSLIAVFLALGIGILVGASMGEKALVMNQIVVIEKLKEEIINYKKEIDHYFLLTSRLQEELGHWESLENDLAPLLIKNQLQEVSLKVFSQEKLSPEVENFLRLSDCTYTAYIFANIDAFEETGILELLKKELQYGPDTNVGELLANELGRLLLDEEPLFGHKVADILQAGGLLDILEQGPEKALFSSAKKEDIGEKMLFIVAGKIEVFLQPIINRVIEEGGTIIYLSCSDDEGKKEGYLDVVSNAGNVYHINDFSKFFNRFELLKIIQEVNSKG